MGHLEYFTQNDWESEYLPPISWEAMLESGRIIAPTTMVNILTDAEHFLVTAPGPNLVNRKIDAPVWFNFWEELLFTHAQAMEDVSTASPLQSYGYTEGLKPFDEVASYVKKRGLISGANMMGEGAGRPGHIWTYEWMRKKLGHESTVVWAFEQPEYFEYKVRPAPFLPLIVRLSMAIYLGVDVATVLPLPPAGACGDELSAHYLDVFKRLGVDYQFADDADPHVQEKVVRGKVDRDTIIPHFEFPSTSDGVRKLLDVRGFRDGSSSTGDDDDLAFILSGFGLSVSIDLPGKK